MKKKEGLSGIPNSPLLIHNLQVPVFICAKKDGCLDMLNQMEHDLRLGMLHLNYDDDISVIPDLVKQVLVKEKITYVPSSDCRYFCMNKSGGTLHIYTNKTGLVSDVFALGDGENCVFMIDETFPKIDKLEDFGISLETQSSSEDEYNFKQPELLDESGCGNVGKFYNERLYKTTPNGVYPFITTMADGHFLSGKGHALYAEISEKARGKTTVDITGNCSLIFIESVLSAYAYLCIYNASIEKKQFRAHFLPAFMWKNGPSAGGGIAVAMMSCFLKRPAKQNTIVFAELSQKGKLIAVGGLAEKIQAAKRIGIKEIILPLMMKEEWFDLPEIQRSAFTPHFVEEMEDVFAIVFPKEETDRSVEQHDAFNRNNPNDAE